jgi:hypothetical protein
MSAVLLNRPPMSSALSCSSHACCFFVLKTHSNTHPISWRRMAPSSITRSRRASLVPTAPNV